MTPFRFHREARAEQRLAVEEYTLRSHDAGDRFADALELIRRKPKTWPLWKRRPGIHAHRVRGFPFRMIYVIHKGQVFIVAVVHYKRRPPRLR